MGLRQIVSLASALVLAGCSQAGLFAANLPTRFNDTSVERDVAFGPEKWQKLDIYRPSHIGARKLDVVVFYYGGRWETGSKDDYRFVGSALAQQDFVVVIADYRKYPQVKFPLFVEDAAQSLSWVYDHIGDYNGNPDHINIAGHSAGAHIGALLAADPHYLKDLGKDRGHVIKSFAGLAGPYDFTPDAKDLVAMFGPPSQYPKMKVPTFIDGKEPPMLLLYGDRDQYVGRFNLDNLVHKIKAKKGCVATRIYPGLDHIWIVGALSWLGETRAPVLADMVAFFRDPAKDCQPTSR